MERSALPAEAMEGMFGSVPAMSTIVRFEHRTDAVDGEAEPARDLPVRRLELTPLGHLGVELLRELGAIGAERLNLRGQGLDAAVGIAPALGRSLQGVERGNQPAGRRLDRAGVDRSRLIASRHGLWSAHLPLSPTPARRLAPRARIADIRFPGAGVSWRRASVIPISAFCGFVVISSRAPSTYAQKFAPQFRPDCVDLSPSRAISPAPRDGGSFVAFPTQPRREIPLPSRTLRLPRREGERRDFSRARQDAHDC